jgi:hypothetical protein
MVFLTDGWMWVDVSGWMEFVGMTDGWMDGVGWGTW